MFKKVLLALLLVVALGAVVGWHYRVQILDSMCGTTPPASDAQLKEALKNGAMILDVRMYVETRKEGANLVPGAMNIPLLRLTSHLDELPRDREIITFCVSGKRAGKSADMLKARGFQALSGGGIANVERILEEVKQ